MTRSRPLRRVRMVGTVLLAVLIVSGCGHGGRRPAAGSGASGVAAGPSAGGSPTVSDHGFPRAPAVSAATPTSVAIPKLGVTSRLVDLGLLADGTMAVPVNADAVGWFTGGSAPGAIGPAVLAGHVDWQGKKGAFADLATLVAGDRITVGRSDGSTVVFAVTSVGRYPKDQFPTQAVYGPIANAGLRLITCGGEFDPATHHYLDNIVVFADLI